MSRPHHSINAKNIDNTNNHQPLLPFTMSTCEPQVNERYLTASPSTLTKETSAGPRTVSYLWRIPTSASLAKSILIKRLKERDLTAYPILYPYSICNDDQNSVFIEINRLIKRQYYGMDKIYLNVKGKKRLCNYLMELTESFNNFNSEESGNFLNYINKSNLITIQTIRESQRNESNLYPNLPRSDEKTSNYFSYCNSKNLCNGEINFSNTGSVYSANEEDRNKDNLNAEVPQSKTAKDVMTLYYQNERGLRTKTNELYDSLLECGFDVLTFTETGLNDSFYKTRGGGVLVAVSSEFESSLVHSINCNGIEAVWVLVKVRNKKFIISTVYIPPKSRIESYNYYFDAFECLETLLVGTELIIAGDFNLPQIKHQNYKFSQDCKITKTLSNIMNLYYLKSINNVVNQVDNTLDLIITNTDCTILEDPLPLTKVDKYHPPLNIVINLPKLKTKKGSNIKDIVV
ncbi:hypothetical protein ILUMI_16516, partial [Ignelater luminosus]